VDTNQKTIINALLKQAGLDQADEIQHLGHGEFNDSHYIKSGAKEFCLRIARYDDNNGLAREADALSRVPRGIAPQLIYFSRQTNPIDHLWIIESYIDGTTPKRLSLEQFNSMGTQLAQIHTVLAPDHDIVDRGEVTGTKTELWQYLMWNCRAFYTPAVILTDLPDIRITRLAQKIKIWLDEQQERLDFPMTKHLLHKDITPGNVLVRGDEVFLIDWELRDFGDPMADFATGFWDIDLKRGKWRIALNQEEQNALYGGYTTAGGVIDQMRIQVWTMFDKFGVAVFLCHRIHAPTDDTNPELQTQYKEDLESIIASLGEQF
jgi:aminoglycoside phosphotransferase (APT) family kinase protein